jgi:uncharacterized protein (TIGR02145 family)
VSARYCLNILTIHNQIGDFMGFINRQVWGRALLLAAMAVMAVGAICLFGCGGEDGGANPGNNSGDNPGEDTDNNTGGNPGGNTGGVTKADIAGYRTVTIGNQVWTAENLNHETGNSWCYGNDSSNCDKYGRLYDWETAMKVCPSGWRLPSIADWDDLVATVGGLSVAGRKLKSTSGWSSNGNGTDEYGWSALPGGHRNSAGGFGLAGSDGLWWTATESNSDFAYNRNMSNVHGGMGGDGFYKGNGFSVRCVKD